MYSNSDKVLSALETAKEIKQITFYLFANSYKVGPAEGIALSDRVLALSIRLVDDLGSVGQR